MAVVHDIIQALRNINGQGKLREIFNEYQRINDNPIESTIRRTLQEYSSDSRVYKGGRDLFYSVDGIGNGKWGLREYLINVDVDQSGNDEVTTVVTAQGNENPQRKLSSSNRIIRDTALAKELKQKAGHKCQICDLKIPLPNGKYYIEAHHIKPLGKPFNGPDVKKNIIIVCPNCHVNLDYKLISLNKSTIKNDIQNIGEEYIEFHNQQYSVKSFE